MKIKLIPTVMLLALCQVTNAIDFQYKQVEDFDTLESFESVAEFESSYADYVQDCLDNTGGGLGGVPCFIGYKIWDRELTILYKRLEAGLDSEAQKLLQQSQRAWIEQRDSSIEFNSKLLDTLYTEPGTIYTLMRAGDTDDVITPMIKHRTLTFKKWLKTLETE